MYVDVVICVKLPVNFCGHVKLSTLRRVNFVC